MKDDNEIVETLIAGGVIGAALGSLLSKSNGNGSILGAIAGAALLATFRANEQAQKTNVTMIFEENEKLYERQPGGNKKFIRTIKKSTKKLSAHFKLA